MKYSFKTVAMYAVLLSITACQQAETKMPLKQESIAQNFVDKKWKINSLVTQPALIDVDGDDELDAEIIASLDDSERNKKVIFSANGSVFEKKVGRKAGFIEYEIVRNGTWKRESDTFLKWVQKNNSICVVDTRDSKSNLLRISSFDFENDIRITRSMDAQFHYTTKYLTLWD